jgi:glycosyltransferase involved in cell wall biosynthesis
MKILQVFDWFSPLHGGGTVDLMYEFSHGLEQRGHKVGILTSDYELDLNYIESLTGVDVFTLANKFAHSGIFYCPDMAKFPVWNYDLVHFQIYRSLNNVMVAQQCRKHDVPYIIDSHGSAIRTQGVKSLLKLAYDIVWGFNDLNHASKLIAQTPIGVEEYKVLGAKENQIIRINPPLDIKPYETLPEYGKFRHRFGFHDEKIIMYMGRMSYIKGLDFLVESFYDLTKVRNDVVLVLVGAGGDYRKQLEALIKKRGLTKKVVFTGFLGGELKREALVDADVMIQPSRHEQGVRPLFEALLCNTPGICTRHTGAGEQLAEFSAGKLVDFGDTHGLARTIRYMLDNVGETKEWVREAKERIKVLSLENHIQEFEKIYRGILDCRIPKT